MDVGVASFFTADGEWKLMGVRLTEYSPSSRGETAKIVVPVALGALTQIK